MTTESQKVMYLQSTQPMQAVVILCFLSLQRPMTIEEITHSTPISNNSVRAAVAELAAKDMLIKQTGAHGKVTWYPGGQTFIGLLPELQKAFEIQVNKIRDSGAPITITTNTKLALPSMVINNNNSGQVNKIRDSGIVYDDPKVTYKLNVSACQEVGIGGEARADISALPWASPEYIKAMVNDLRDHDTIGLAILRMEDHQSPSAQARDDRRKHRKDNKAAGSKFFEICGTCNQAPCTCYEHADDCDCISCQQEFPERFCTFTIGTTHPRACGALIKDGSHYCKTHAGLA